MAHHSDLRCSSDGAGFAGLRGEEHRTVGREAAEAVPPAVEDVRTSSPCRPQRRDLSDRAGCRCLGWLGVADVRVVEGWRWSPGASLNRSVRVRDQQVGHSPEGGSSCCGFLLRPAGPAVLDWRYARAVGTAED